MSEPDLLILGGGPGGTAAAITAAQRGLRVVLMEQQAFPRHAPGETLHPGVEPLLRQLGVRDEILAAGFLRHQGHWIAWDGPARFEAFGADAEGPWLGFQAFRAEFDAILLAQARKLGCTLLQPCRALRARLAAGRVVGVETEQGEFAAPYVIDASGGSHWLARQLGLTIHHHSRRLLARYGYVQGASVEEAPRLVADPDGWTWTATVRPGIRQWTRLRFSGQPPDRNRVPEGLESFPPWTPVHGAEVTWRHVPEAAGPGYFLVGDAAAVLDPVSSHGVLKALMSGIMAGHLLGGCLAPGARLSESTAIRNYRTWLNAWFEHDLARLRELYGLLGQDLGPDEPGE